MPTRTSADEPPNAAGGFVDSALKCLLGLRAPDEGVVYTIVAGHPARS